MRAVDGSGAISAIRLQLVTFFTHHANLARIALMHIARDIPRTVTCTCGATCGFRLEIIVIVIVHIQPLTN